VSPRAALRAAPPAADEAGEAALGADEAVPDEGGGAATLRLQGALRQVVTPARCAGASRRTASLVTSRPARAPRQALAEKDEALHECERLRRTVQELASCPGDASAAVMDASGGGEDSARTIRAQTEVISRKDEELVELRSEVRRFLIYFVCTTSIFVSSSPASDD
jgi:hypothetical protein